MLEQGHMSTSTHQNHIQMPGYYPSYYPVGNAFMPPSLGPFFGINDNGQDAQQSGSQSFDANPYNIFSRFIN